MRVVFKSLLRTFRDTLPPRIQTRLAALRSFRNPILLGQRAFVHPSVQILGRAFVRIGLNSILSQDCWLNVNHRTGKKLAIIIGDHCFIGRRNFFSSGKRIEFGHYVLTANDCHFLGSSHNTENPLLPCITTGTTDTDTINVGHNTFIGAGARIIGDVSIGHGCIIGACSLVIYDIPPFSKVAGFPATARSRYSFIQKKWIPVSDFTADDELALPDAETYLKHLLKYPPPRMPYLAAGNDMGEC